MKFGWKTRVGLVLSAVWLCLIFLIAEDYHRTGQILGVGILPLIVVWGITWAVAGWRAQRTVKPELSETVTQETKRRRVLRLRTVVTVIVVMALGLFAATWQFHVAGDEVGGNAISYWFGQWLVYGLLVYLVCRIIPRMRYGFPAFLATIVVVGGVNFKAYATINESREARISVAKAAPFINKILSGTQVSDEEIKAAKIGAMEPLILAQAAFSRDVSSISDTYVKAVSALNPELMLSPASLVSPNIRLQTRAKLKLSQEVTVEYKTQMDAALNRAKLNIQAAQLQMPAAMAEGVSKGFQERSDLVNTYLSSVLSSEEETRNTIIGILDLLDAHPGGYAIDKGPPPNLLFRDEAVLMRYRELMTALITIGQRQKEAEADVLKAQSDITEKLTGFLQR